MGPIAFDDDWRGQVRDKPRILVLEVRPRLTPQAAPLAWLVVERTDTEAHDPRDGTVHRASIHLRYQLLGTHRPGHSRDHGEMTGSYLKSGGEPHVSLTSPSVSRGGVFLDLPGLEGQRIGTYLMNEIVRWAKRWPDAEVESVELLPGQAGWDNKARRNRFYEQFGLRFCYTDAEKREGESLPMRAADLTTVDTWAANIKELRVMDYLAELMHAEESARLDLAWRTRVLQELETEWEAARAPPLRFTARQLWARFARPKVVFLMACTAIVALRWHLTGSLG